MMTFNLRYDKPDPGDRAWILRRSAIAALMAHYQPDLIGTQEGKGHQLFDLLALLPDYQMIGRDRTGGGHDEYCAILYRNSLSCVGNGDFFLSETPDIPGSITTEWGNSLPRMVTWGIFTTPDHRKIALFNTHLDYQSAKARELSAVLICDRISQLTPEDAGIFLTGDFNADPGSIPRQIFQRPLGNGRQLKDALTILSFPAQMTFHDFTGKAFAAIDTIYYDQHWKLKQVRMDTQRWQKIWPSDHFPAIAIFD